MATALRHVLTKTCQRFFVSPFVARMRFEGTLSTAEPKADEFVTMDEEELARFRDSIRRWVDSEVIPNLSKWEEGGRLPRDLYRQASKLGILAPGFPVKYGGLGNDQTDMSTLVVVVEELCRAGSGGLIASLLTHNISIPPIIAMGSKDIIERVVPGVLAGERVCALGVTEPGGGSDVANMRTRACLDVSGENYILNGEKTLITSGMQADYYTIAARTGSQEAGAKAISLFLVERNAPGFYRTSLPKMGWWCSDTAALHFDDCVIPKSNLLGTENHGFGGIMRNFNSERIFMAAQSVCFSKELMNHAVNWAKERKTFGKRLIEHQAIRHRIVDMATEIASADALLRDVLTRFAAGENCVAEICMLKNKSTDCMHLTADSAVQILGGAGFVRGHLVERLYRETKVMQIGGGSTEIMKDLAAKQMGLMSF